MHKTAASWLVTNECCRVIGKRYMAYSCLHRLLCAALLAASIGCSDQPAAVKAPPIDPSKSVEACLLQYDTNTDRRLSREELASCPALLNAIDHYDQDGDKEISATELMNRFVAWGESGLGISTLACRVTLKGQPLANAAIRFVPEDCFAGVLQPATGTTDESGTAMLSIDAAHLPPDAHNMRGVQQGLYRVEVTHAKVKIPAKYNTETRLGKEISFELGENFITFSL